MKRGDHLIDIQRGATTYRVEGLLAAGERYQLARAVHEPGGDESGGNEVAVRTILYSENADEVEITGRRLGLRREWEFLSDLKESGFVPKPLDWLMIEASPVEQPPEPLIVCEKLAGKNLYDWVRANHPEGMEPAQVLALTEQIARFLSLVHKKKYLLRDFDPRRFLIDEDRTLRLVSTGAVVKLGAPLDETQRAFNPAYVAPEVRDELTGSMQRPTADLYGLGALMSFLLTGEEPREQVESPLSFTAFESLQRWEEPGMELLVARLLQPLAKKRIGRAERLQQFLSLETLPQRTTKGFEMTMLPAPWLGLEMKNPQDNRALKSKLSAGPLVSVVRESAAPDQETDDAGPRETPEWPGAAKLNWPLVLVLAAMVVAAVLFAFLR